MRRASPALLALGLVSAALAVLGVPARAQTVRNDLPLTNGMVNALLLSGSKLYLGGSFTRIGNATGCGVPIDTASAAPVSGFPAVTGTIQAAIPDGAGGWFIGGSFTSVGGQPRQNLAHVLADLSVSGWNPGADQTVFALAQRNGVVYAGGDFQNIGGSARARLAALDSLSGSAVAWNPGADGTVRALALTDSVIYASGSFLNAGGVLRLRLVALDLVSGVASPWNPGANGTVFTLATGAGVVYAGGLFSQLGGSSRVDLGAIDAATGVATPWNPQPDNQVLTLAVSGPLVYAGGMFTKFAGVSHGRIAALDAATGAAVTGWNPAANGRVLALYAKGPVVYAGGEFTIVGGQPRTFVAALDSVSGNATGWNPSAYAPVLALAPGGSALYVAGSFNGIAGTNRRSLAAVDLTNGAITSWDPQANAPVLALAAGNGTILAGGSFTSAGGQARGAVAALDTLNGAATSWNPGVDNMVSALAVSGATAYVGGTFTTLGGQSRSNVGAVDLASGVTTSWNPGIDGQVSTIALSAGRVYVGGSFTTVNGQGRQNLAVVDSATQTVGAWNPNANGTVRALIPTCGEIYAAGFFTTIGGATRNRMALLDATTATAGAWNPNANGPVFSMALENGALYTSGLFSTIGGQSRTRVASLDPASGSATSWNPGADNLVLSFVKDASTVYAGGSFANLGQASVSGLAGIQPDGSLSCPALAFSPASLPDGSTGVAYNQTIAPSGSTAPYCLALTGTLPPGLTFDALSGHVSGTPTAFGTFPFSVTATSATACPGAHDYQIVVARTCPPITVAPPTLPAARLTFAYDETLSASGAVPPSTFSVSSGSLPAGLTLSPDGVLSGTPTTTGTASFTVTVSDSFLCQGSKSYTMNVFPPCSAIAIAPRFPASGVVGAAYDQGFTASGGHPPYTWSVASGTLPGGLTLDGATGHVHGTPALADTFPVVLAATDSIGCTQTRSYVLAVFATTPVSSVAADVSGLMITNGHACVSVPVKCTRGESAPLQSLRFTLALETSRLALCAPGTPAATIHPGSWLNGHPNASFGVTDNGDGSYDVDLELVGEPCGVDSGGTLATIDLTAAGPDGSGSITVLGAVAHDCAGALAGIVPGAPAQLAIDRQALAIQPTVIPGGAVGAPYAVTLSTSAGSAPFAWSVTSGSLPAGLSLGAASGSISGTPSASGSFYFGVTAVDAYGRTGSRSYSVAVFDSLPGSMVYAATAGLCLTTAAPQRSVPFVYSRVDAAAARAVSVTFEIDTSKVALATPGNAAASVHVGTWLASTAHVFFVTPNGGGSYTVDMSVLGSSPCGLTTGGELFTVDLVPGLADGQATLAVTAVRVRDCSNTAIAAAAGPPSTLSVDRAGPVALSALAATAQTVIGSSDSTIRVALQWNPGSVGQVSLYRAPHGTYPLYADDSPAPDTTLVPGGPWVLVATDPSPGFVDLPPGRGLWDYVAVTTDACGVTAMSNTTRGVLDYLLGDVSNGLRAGTGDDQVGTADVSLLGFHYGVIGAASDSVGYLDVGPTLSGLPDSRPLPDHQIDFEDLVIFSIAYGNVASPPGPAPLRPARAAIATAKSPAILGANEFGVFGPSSVEAGSEIADTLRVSAGGGMHAFSARLVWDATVVEPLAVQTLGFLEAQGGVVLSSRPGTVDGALLGVSGNGVSGDGDVAVIRFRALKSGLTGVGLGNVDARDATNHSIFLATTGTGSVPKQTLLLAPAPNPARQTAGLSYTLAHRAAVNLVVYDLGGRRVRTLMSGVQEAGAYRRIWDARDDRGRAAAAGVYYVVFQADGHRMSQRLVLLR
ncbi:MAG TPA: putative Ig domain-containing protein [Candidatus Eisenbacteria bacterium]|nr:putative Ig domain-containing protein [Candidatus Eisenbacteria bacterium]